MNIIIGKNGFIAKKLLERNSYLSTSSTKNGKNLYLDLLNPKDFDYSIINKNSKIIFLAAVSSPDECNNNYDNSYKINVIGTKYFITEALSYGAKVLFFSSDVIYGNTIKEVNENSATNPFGNYADMKDEVELFFKDKINFKVFRLSYVLSKEDKYLKYLKNCIAKNEIAEVFHPFARKVIFLEDVLDAIESILMSWNHFPNQKFNICGRETISRKDIADFYKNIDSKLNYSLEEPDDDFWKARPKDININSLYLEKLLGHSSIKVEDAIKSILKEKN